MAVYLFLLYFFQTHSPFFFIESRTNIKELFNNLIRLDPVVPLFLTSVLFYVTLFQVHFWEVFVYAKSCLADDMNCIRWYY